MSGAAGAAPLPHRHVARVRYTEATVRRAVREFVWRSLRRRGWAWGLAAVLLAACAGLSLAVGDGFTAGCATAVLLLVPLFWAAVWAAHFRGTVGRFRALDPKEAEVGVDGDGITLRSSAGQVSLPWGRFTAVWVLPDCWMLFVGPSQFITLPTADLPGPMLEALRARLPAPDPPFGAR